jgi:peptide/nickel transport system ATP-binding protein
LSDRANNELLAVTDLSISFGDTLAVKNVSYSVNPGETLAIVGASGSGKSVGSLALMGLLHPSARIRSGSAIYTGADGTETDLLSLTPSAHRLFRGTEIAMVFQEPMTALNPVHRCGDQVAEALLRLPGTSKSKRRERVIELFDSVKLPNPEEAYAKYPHQMSGGQKQRVMIAMAMSCNPRLIIADEPTTALDVTVQHEVLQLLADLQKSHGLGMLFITHDLGVVEEIADRVVVMQKGCIVEEGPVKNVLEKAEHPYTKGLINSRPPMSGHPKRLPTVEDFLRGSVPADTQIMISSEARRKEVDRMMKKAPILQVRGLSKSFGDRKARTEVLTDLEFDIYPGETLGLIGGSGSGKTTLGRSLLQLIHPDSGSVKYKGTELTDLSESTFRTFRRKLQIIFQDPYSSLNPKLTAGEAIMEVLQVHKLHNNDRQRKEYTLELLDQVGLESVHYGRYPHEFSGGQRQRIVIARTIAVAPELVICDESVSALDVSVQAQVLNLLNDLKEQHGLTYVFISHDMAVVKYMCDRMIVLDKGRIAELGNSDEIFNDPRSNAAQQLIAAIPGLTDHG